MNSNDHTSNHNPDLIGRVSGADALPVLEPELAALDAGLGELASADRSLAPAGMNERVFEASRAGIAGAPRHAVVARIGPGPARRSWTIGPLRVAAGLAMAATVALALVASLGRPRAITAEPALLSAALESEVTEWLALSNGMMGDLAVQINSLDADSDSLREEFLFGLPSGNLFLDEGAF